MIECTLHDFHQWLDEQGWPSEIILHPDDFTLLQARFGPGDRKLLFDDWRNYFICGPTRIRPGASNKKFLDVSKERLFK